jgi:drug/metabolite transporter (DMT)-like permease
MISPAVGLPRFIAVLVLLLAALCWGAGNVANKTVLEHLPPLTGGAGHGAVCLA